GARAARSHALTPTMTHQRRANATAPAESDVRACGRAAHPPSCLRLQCTRARAQSVQLTHSNAHGEAQQQRRAAEPTAATRSEATRSEANRSEANSARAKRVQRAPSSR